MLEKIISIVVFVVAFALLICIHEAGHLSMAKLFNVYCKEYSIGFGPAIYSKKRKGHETKFSVRCVPLGGFVSMYGEESEKDPEFKDIPKERSIEGIKKWKKALVVSAGVILNAILAFVLIAISNLAFKTTFLTRNASVFENSLVEAAGIKDNDRLEFIIPDYLITEDSINPFSYEYTDSEKIIHAGSFYIVDNDIYLNEENYVLTFMFTGNKKEPVFTDGLLLYKAVSKEDLQNKPESSKLFLEWANQENSPEYYPCIEDGAYSLKEDTEFFAELSFISHETSEHFSEHIKFTTESYGKGYVFKNIGLAFKLKKEWLPFNERFRNIFIDYGNASSAVFKGLGVLFSGGIKNMSGVVGILQTSTSIYSSYTFASYLYFWGLISVNLAIFNLLPFPALDGWQLLVTCIEGITKKKLPQKFKTIMSFIGLALLVVLMVIVLYLDITRLV